MLQASLLWKMLPGTPPCDCDVGQTCPVNIVPFLRIWRAWQSGKV